MVKTKTRTLISFDGTEIAYRILGEGRPTLLLHGFLANAEMNWIQPGIAEAIVNAGRQVIAPDLRAHGDSAAPVGAEHYPPDALAMDQGALLGHLGITDFDLVGYSLGARMAVRMLARGAHPHRCVLGGLGDSGVMDVPQRQAYFEGLIRDGAAGEHKEAGAYVHGLLKQRGLDKNAMLNVLRQQVSTTAEELQRIKTPILVVSGVDDEDNGSAEGLAAALPHAIAKRTPGNHLSAVAAPELAREIVAFLTAH